MLWVLRGKQMASMLRLEFTLPEANSKVSPWKWMVGILHSCWGGLFSRATLVSGRVHKLEKSPKNYPAISSWPIAYDSLNQVAPIFQRHPCSSRHINPWHKLWIWTGPSRIHSIAWGKNTVPSEQFSINWYHLFSQHGWFQVYWTIASCWFHHWPYVIYDIRTKMDMHE